MEKYSTEKILTVSVSLIKNSLVHRSLVLDKNRKEHISDFHENFKRGKNCDGEETEQEEGRRRNLVVCVCGEGEE